MNIREALESKQTEIISTSVNHQNLEWRGVGARLKVATEHDEALMNAFVLERLDNQFRCDGVQFPLVLRTVGEAGEAANVSDYVMYPAEDDAVTEAAVYRAPRTISNIKDYLYGEWPIADSFVNKDGMQDVLSAMEATLTDSGLIEVIRANKIKSFTNLGSISLRAAGTAPIQPVRYIG